MTQAGDRSAQSHLGEGWRPCLAVMGKNHPWQQNIHQIEISDITDILENAETFSYLPQRHVLLLATFPRQWGSTRQASDCVNNVFNNSLRREGFFHLVVSHDPAMVLGPHTLGKALWEWDAQGRESLSPHGDQKAEGVRIQASALA